MIIINYLELEKTDKDYLRLKNLHIACFDDKTGKKFGKLTAICVDHIKGKSYYWKCKCDCGNYSVVLASALSSGHTKSCGCLHKLAGMKDLTGKKFGALTVINYSKKEGRYHFWKCKCECGNEVVVKSNYLTTSKFPSCGCISVKYKGKLKLSKRKHELSGNKYGKLLALYPVVGSRWHCKCDCGNYTDVKTSDLIRGYTKSCGCTSVNYEGSAPELEIKEYVSALLPNTPIIKEKILHYGKRDKEIDIFIPNLKIGIEFNGSAFHASKNTKIGKDKPKYYHRDKFLQARKQGIRLISIFDKDFYEDKNKIFKLIYNVITNTESHTTPTDDVIYTNNDFDDGNWLKPFGYIEVCQIEPTSFTYTRDNYVVFRCGKTKWEKLIPR